MFGTFKSENHKFGSILMDAGYLLLVNLTSTLQHEIFNNSVILQLNIFLHAGGGIFVVESRSHKNVALANNSMVTINSQIIDFVCYTNSSDSDGGYIILPNNMQYNDTEQVRRISPSGIQFQNNNNRLRISTGIYTCRLPDSNGKILDFNLGVYTSARGIHHNIFK